MVAKPSQQTGISGATAPLRERLLELGATKTPYVPDSNALMLAETREGPFSGSGWIFELKYDGYRTLARKTASTVELRSRSGRLMTSEFPNVSRALAALRCDTAVFDAEIVMLDEKGRPSFQRLQQRASSAEPAVLFAFDLLHLDGLDLRGLKLSDRKALLREILSTADPCVKLADHVDAQGEALFSQVLALNLEGMMAKRAASRYRAGRSEDWLKICVERRGDFVVVGYTLPEGSRTGLGSLHLAAHHGNDLVYVGKAGSGFSLQELALLTEALDRDRIEKPACSFPPDTRPSPPRSQRWCSPRLVCEVRFKAWTDSGQLRQSVFLRLRSDKRPEQCDLPNRPR
jgi:bifunctional non-homologous end joining protein LigD